MRDLLPLLGILAICGTVSPAAAEESPNPFLVGIDTGRLLAVYPLGATTNARLGASGGADSLPSGRAPDIMTFTTTLERRWGWRFYVPVYAFASAIAMSSLRTNLRYVSDPMLGSAVGIIASHTAVRRASRDFPVHVTTTAGGAAVMFVKRPR